MQGTCWISSPVHVLMPIETQAVASIRTIDGISITSSFGVSSTKYGASDLAALINQTDEALYKSKEKGRNCVTTWVQLKDVSTQKDSASSK